MTATIEPTTMPRLTVVGVFTSPDEAERALKALKAAGITPEQVSVVARDPEQTADLIEAPPTTDGGIGQGAGTGAIAGGAFGGLGGFILAVSALPLPGIGPIVGAGIIAATILGAGLGVSAGGLVGALLEEGVNEEAAREYEQHVGQGSILLGVRARDLEEARQAHHAFVSYGGEAVRAYGVAEELLR
jgi:uncharacterized membrane protein